MNAGKGHLVVTNVTKRYGGAVAVGGVSIDVAPGEFVTLLGPSGSGKTTTLRIVAGFVDPDSGSVQLDGRALTGVPPYRRDIGMVFQNYALFPHMSAADNIAFPLKMRSVSRTERGERVKHALDLVHLGGLGSRRPAQLSGGQQQRVALARAIVFNPTVLLMDEPLGALDKKLREALQLEISRVSRTLGVTVLYVTHDQEEALALSDRIAIYRNGLIEQLGTGEDLYERPASLFVAGFMGESSLFRGRVSLRGSVAELDCECGCIRLTRERVSAAVSDGSRAALVVRPERITVNGNSTDGDANSVRGVLREVVYLGATRKASVELRDGTTVLARLHPEALGGLAPGADVAVEWSAESGVLVPDEAS